MQYHQLESHKEVLWNCKGLFEGVKEVIWRELFITGYKTIYYMFHLNTTLWYIEYQWLVF